MWRWLPYHSDGRWIVLHGMLNNHATVAAACAFRNDRDGRSALCGPFFYVLLSTLLLVTTQFCQSCSCIVVEMSSRVALFGIHTLYNRLILIWCMLHISIEWCLLLSWNVQPCIFCLYAYIYVLSCAMGVCCKMVQKVIWSVVEKSPCRDRTRSGAIGLKAL